MTPETMTPEDLARFAEICHHEAGHSAVALLLGFPPGEVTASAECGRSVSLVMRGTEIGTVAHLLSRAIVTAAGPAAEARYRGVNLETVYARPQSDGEEIATLVHEACVDERAVPVVRSFVHELTEVLVEDVWPAVERLAAAIGGVGTLDGFAAMPHLREGVQAGRDAVRSSAATTVDPDAAHDRLFPKATRLVALARDVAPDVAWTREGPLVVAAVGRDEVVLCALDAPDPDGTRVTIGVRARAGWAPVCIPTDRDRDVDSDERARIARALVVARRRAARDATGAE